MNRTVVAAAVATEDHSRFQPSSLDTTYARMGEQYFGQTCQDDRNEQKISELRSSLTAGMVTDDTPAAYSSDSTTISVISNVLIFIFL